jgi:hypothetical protein
MSPFLHGFASELVKLAANAQRPAEAQVPFEQSIGSSVVKSLGSRAKTELKQPAFASTPQAARQGAPFPTTTPNPMTDY